MPGAAVIGHGTMISSPCIRRNTLRYCALRGLDSRFRGDDTLSVINRPIHAIVVVMEHLDARQALVAEDHGEFVNEGFPVEGIDTAAQDVIEFLRQFLEFLIEPGQLVEIIPGEITVDRRQELDQPHRLRHRQPENAAGHAGEHEEKPVAHELDAVGAIVVHGLAQPPLGVA